MEECCTNISVKWSTGNQAWKLREQCLTPPQVNLANRASIGDTLPQIVQQLKFLKSHWKQNKHVPWIGACMIEHERETWPLLFIYSKNDKLLPWRYVDEVVNTQTSTG